MLVARAGLGLLIAALLQIVLQRLGLAFGISAVAGVDLFLVVVVWIALQSGPVPGQLVGMVGGFLTDALGGGVFGLTAIADTLVGYGAAAIRQRVVLQRGVQVLIFGVAAVVQQLVSTLVLVLLASDPELVSLSSVGARVVTTAALGGALLASETRARRGWSRWQRRRRSRLRLR